MDDPTKITLGALDVAIVIAYFVLVVLIGLLLAGKAAKGLEDYFLGGRRIPWWILGASGSASNFDMTGTMVITSFFFMLGFQGFWMAARGGLVLLIPAIMAYVARWLRRTRVVTTAELLELRFGSGAGGKAARLLGALVAITIQVGMIVYFAKGTGKFVAEFTGFTPDQCATGMVVIGLFYTMLSGLYGVVYTDIFQEAVLFLAAGYVIVQAFFLPDHAAVIASAGPGWTDVTPLWTAEPMPWLANPDVYHMFGIFVAFQVCRTFLVGASGSGFGYVAQRFYAAADERSASLMAAEWTVLLSIRWAMVAGVAILGLSLAYDYPEIRELLHADPEQTLPVVFNHLLPVGFKGLAIAGLIAAAMSTFDSTLNVAASYWVRDVYQRFIRPKATQKQLIHQSYGVSIVMCGAALAVAMEVDSIDRVWNWLMGELGVAVMIPLFLRWYWWRFNGWGFAAGSVGGLLGAIAMALLDHGLAAHESFLITAAFSFTACVVVTFATPPVDEASLRKFHRQVRPWGLWRPLASTEPLVSRGHAARDIFNAVVALVWQISMFAAAALFVMHEWQTFFLMAGTTIGLSIVLYFTWYLPLPAFGETLGESESAP